VSDATFERLRAEAADPETSPARLEDLARDPQLASLVAANPAASADLLRLFALGNDQEIRVAVAANPNAHWDTILGLAGAFPESFIANPAIPLLLVEDPSRVTQLTNVSAEVVLTLLRVESVPDWLIAALSQHRSQSVREAATYHICAAGEAVDEQSALHALRSAFLGNDHIGSNYFAMLFVLPPDRPADWLIDLLARHTSPSIRQIIASRADTTQPLLEHLLVDQDPIVRKGVALHPDLPLDVYTCLIGDTDANVRQAAARNMLMQLPIDLVEQLARASKAGLRRIAALHPGLAPATLERLAGDDNIAVRRCVALNPSTSLAMLEKIMDGETTWAVRLAIAGHHNTSVALLEQLATDAQWAVRHDVFWNPHASNEALNTILTKDKLDHHVVGFGPISERLTAFLSQNVRANKLRRMIRKSNNSSYQPARSALADKNLSAEEIIALAQQGDVVVRRAIAANPRTPAALLTLLTRGGDIYVARDAAGNPNTPPSVLTYLGVPNHMSENGWILSNIAQNPATPYIVSALLSDVSDHRARYAARVACSSKAAQFTTSISSEPELSVENRRRLLSLFLALSQSPVETSLSRMLGLSYPVLTADVLAKEAQSLAWPGRYIVARHPNADQATLERLAHDGNRFVRAMAQERLRM